MATTTTISELKLHVMRAQQSLCRECRDRAGLMNERQAADESWEYEITRLMRRETSMGKTSWAWRNPHVYSYELAEMKASWR